MKPKIHVPARRTREQPSDPRPDHDIEHRPDEETPRRPPDALPNPMPGLDPQQTPGIDRADDEGGRFASLWLRTTRGL